LEGLDLLAVFPLYSGLENVFAQNQGILPGQKDTSAEWRKQGKKAALSRGVR
jgi:hypothetical protein